MSGLMFFPYLSSVLVSSMFGKLVASNIYPAIRDFDSAICVAVSDGIWIVLISFESKN